VIFDSVTAAIGIYLATCGMVGFFRGPMGVTARVLATLGGLAAIIPDSHLRLLIPGLLSVCGILVGGTVLVLNHIATKRAKAAQG
jgi:hypothetical protein